LTEHRRQQPSAKQQERFLNLAGYPYPLDEMKGFFKTDRPFNKDDWEYSPWWVHYQFHPETGWLFAQLSHRMTNNRCYGWDQDGRDLPFEEVEKVYPAHI